MEYADFYDLAEYANNNWKGNYTQKEVACNAYDYLCEYEASKKANQLSHTMENLIDLLKRDGSEECAEWSEKLQVEGGD
jgi:hypothetical protein